MNNEQLGVDPDKHAYIWHNIKIMGSSVMKATLALIKKIADELSEKGTYNILSDTQHRLPTLYWCIKWQ